MTVMPDCNINDKITAVVRMILLMVTRRRWRKRMSWSSERRKGEGSSSNLYTHYRYHFLIRHRSLLIALCLGIQLTFPRPWISKENVSVFIPLPLTPSPLTPPATCISLPPKTFRRRRARHFQKVRFQSYCSHISEDQDIRSIHKS